MSENINAKRKKPIPSLAVHIMNAKLENKRIKIHAIIETNMRPHPYSIKEEVADFARKFYKGEVTDATLEAYETSRGGVGCCGMPGCMLRYNEHVFDRVALYRVPEGRIHQSDAAEILKELEELRVKYEIDGYAKYNNKKDTGVIYNDEGKEV